MLIDIFTFTFFSPHLCFNNLTLVSDEDVFHGNEDSSDIPFLPERFEIWSNNNIIPGRSI